MSATVEDVALRAGVSRTTVSRVLNNRHDISPEAAAAVEDAIRSLDYRRDRTNRGRKPLMRDRAPVVRAHALALLIPDTDIRAVQTPLTAQLWHGAEAVARENGFQFQVTRLAEDGTLPPCLNPVQIDGLLVRNTHRDFSAFLPKLPAVWIFESSVGAPPGDHVLPDNAVVGQMAAHHLLQRGHRQLFAFNPVPNHPEGAARIESFTRTAQAAGAQVKHIHSNNGEEIRAFWTKIGAPRGVFVSIDNAATENFYRGVQSETPERLADLDLVCCNNDAARLRALDPRIANIDIRGDEIGRVAAQTLLWRLKYPNEHKRIVLIKPQLLEGQSP